MTRELEIAATPPGLLKALAKRKPFRSGLRFWVVIRSQLIVVLLDKSEEEDSGHCQVEDKSDPGHAFPRGDQLSVINPVHRNNESGERADERSCRKQQEAPAASKVGAKRAALKRDHQKQDREHPNEGGGSIRIHVNRYRPELVDSKADS
ncbi:MULTISPECIES: hypothetical protein [unclassified Curtobacterium]|uniref:hypothetical protein n=1 Tax=unclassified Curtobacterium TaxID=257496 RepID=UPI0012DF4BDB|nr:hypothetical protein [Curtobacterium sp. UNCCL17]